MPTKKKDKKRKGKKRAAQKRLPSAVQGLLQYLGGQDATLQQTRPRGAASAEGADTLSRYLAAKTEALNAVRAQQSGIALSQQLEQQYLAKRAAEDTEKKIAMLSAGLKESDTEKKKAIAEQKRKIAELEGVVQQQGVEQLFKSMREGSASAASSLPSYMRSSRAPSMRTPSAPSFAYGEYGSSDSASTPSFASRATPVWAGDEDKYSFATMSSDYDPFEVQPDFKGENLQFSVKPDGRVEAGGGAAVEMYMDQPPTGQPIIRDKPQKQRRVKLVVTGTASPRPRKAQAGGGAAQPVEAKKSVLSAADLKAAIAERTGTPKSKIKLPSRAKYAAVQSLLSQTSGSSADVISALKELGITLAENIEEV
jgi:hypothetical protein